MTIIKAMLEEIFINAMEIAHKNNQATGDKDNYFITLEQLEVILKEYEG